MAEPALTRDDVIDKVLQDAVAAAMQAFAASKLTPEQIAITAVDLRENSNPRFGSFRGDVAIYPASVMKLFCLAAFHQWNEEGQIKDSEEVRRALRDMIVDSSNDATHYIIDLLTGTTSGPELSDGEMEIWCEKRNALNRYFAARGYEKVNVNQKPWCEGPYGRDRVWVGKRFENRNALTTEATARLLTEMARGCCVSETASEEMLHLLKRDPANTKDSQARFTVNELPAGANFFSKSGWTSTARHDAAYLELPGGKKLVLVTFTIGQATNWEIIPFIARQVIEQI